MSPEIGISHDRSVVAMGVVKSVLNTIARAVAFVVILVIILAGIGLVSGDGLPSNMVLELDARKSIGDKSANGLLDLGDRSRR